MRPAADCGHIRIRKHLRSHRHRGVRRKWRIARQRIAGNRRAVVVRRGPSHHDVMRRVEGCVRPARRGRRNRRGAKSGGNRLRIVAESVVIFGRQRIARAHTVSVLRIVRQSGVPISQRLRGRNIGDLRPRSVRVVGARLQTVESDGLAVAGEWRRFPIYRDAGGGNFAGGNRRRRMRPGAGAEADFHSVADEPAVGVVQPIGVVDIRGGSSEDDGLVVAVIRLGTGVKPAAVDAAVQPVIRGVRLKSQVGLSSLGAVRSRQRQLKFKRRGNRRRRRGRAAARRIHGRNRVGISHAADYRSVRIGLYIARPHRRSGRVKTRGGRRKRRIAR